MDVTSFGMLYINYDYHQIIFTFGLYSAFLAWSAIVFKSRRVSKFTVETIFLYDNYGYSLSNSYI